MARATRDVELYVEGLNDVLRAIGRLPKEANTELRKASVAIAAQDMAPAWKRVAINYAGPWGERIAASVRVKRDRVPAVAIGYTKRVFSGGASSIQVRYPSDKGNTGRGGKHVPAAFGTGANWIETVRGTYQADAIRKWGQAVDDVVRKWGAL